MKAYPGEPLPPIYIYTEREREREKKRHRCIRRGGCTQQYTHMDMILHHIFLFYNVSDGVYGAVGTSTKYREFKKLRGMPRAGSPDPVANLKKQVVLGALPQKLLTWCK